MHGEPTFRGLAHAGKVLRSTKIGSPLMVDHPDLMFIVVIFSLSFGKTCDMRLPLRLQV
jgi:hypothetical protein